MQISFTVGDMVVNLDPEDLNRQIEEAVRDKINYQVRDAISKEIGEWILEELTKQKEKVMEALKPEIEKHMQRFKVDNRY